MIIRDYYEQLYGNIMDTLEEMEILRKVQSSKTEPGRNRNYETEAVIKKSLEIQKPSTR